jgi:hypothetical protein
MMLPIHPRTGLPAIGVLPSGRIVWPVLGGSGEGDGGGSGSGDGGGQGSDNGGTPPEGKTFTQADIDRIVADRLGRERNKYADYDQLKTAADELAQIREQQATETEKALKSAAKETEAKVRAELEPRMLRLEVAIAKGLPEELAARVLSASKRLVGATREELEADASEYFEVAPISATAPPPSFDQGTRGGEGTARPTLASGADLYAQRHKTT